MSHPSPRRRCVLVCQHRSCLRNDAATVLEFFQAAIPLGVFASGSDCMGQCGAGPTVRVMPDDVWYCQVKPGDVAAIVEQHLQADLPVKFLLHPRFHPCTDAHLSERDPVAEAAMTEAAMTEVAMTEVAVTEAAITETAQIKIAQIKID